MSLAQLKAAGAEYLSLAMLGALSTVEISASLRADNERAWREVSAQMSYIPVDYSLGVIDYQVAYYSGTGFPTADISLVLCHDNRFCGIWPLFITYDSKGAPSLGSNGALGAPIHGGNLILPPRFIDSLPRKSVKSMTLNCLVALEAVCRQIGQPAINSSEISINGEGFSLWYDRLMQGGGRVTVRHELFLDLSLSMAEIKSMLRKSYRSLIVSGSKLWRTELVTEANEPVWSEFRQLHREVAGRVTRSDDSWQLQHEAIAANQAFFVCVRDTTGRMVGGGLFHITAHEGVYAIGAYDRSLFDKPVGHVVQYFAIEEMKRREIRWYKLGAQVYPSDTPKPSEKEISIAHFKQGFSSHLFPRHEVCYEY